MADGRNGGSDSGKGRSERGKAGSDGGFRGGDCHAENGVLMVAKVPSKNGHGYNCNHVTILSDLKF